jgi:hypothetical protein
VFALLSVSMNPDRLGVNWPLGEHDAGDSRNDAVLPFLRKWGILGQPLQRARKRRADGKLCSTTTSPPTRLGDVAVNHLISLCSLKRRCREGTKALDESVDRFTP